MVGRKDPEHGSFALAKVTVADDQDRSYERILS